MKKILPVLLSCGLAVSVSFTSTADASSAKHYKNCTLLRVHYKGGVAKNSKVKNKGGKTHYKPYVSAALYNANYKLDRDKDGIACEK